MSYAVVCHGTRLFGQVLAPFVLEEGGLMIVKTHSVTRQAEYARLLFCEALCGTVGVEGIEVFQPFEVVNPYLRAHAWGYNVAAQVFRPRAKIKFLVDYAIRSLSIKRGTDNIPTLHRESSRLTTKIRGPRQAVPLHRFVRPPWVPSPDRNTRTIRIHLARGA
jgi:hypothetical protein